MTTPTTAEKVTRYGLVGEYDASIGELSDGDYVRFEDYEAARATIARLEALVSTAYEEGWRTGTFDASRTDADNDSECRSDWLVSFTRRVLATVKEAKP